MNRKWWHNKVFYQIYPKSFCDSNGDGIGDINGIISKLDYLKKLGVDVIWISPMYCSPLADQGYDISDYYNIDPRFGTMEDFDHLLAEAKKRNMYIVMDLVVNHCSDEHEWFRKACEDPDGKYGSYFYIKDWHEGEPLPTNWRSYFGGPCWDLLPGHTDKVYLHVFHKKQPDLNWENEETRRDIYKMVNWWLDKGVAGFRIDAIINIKKALPFSSYPADREDGFCSINRMLENANGIEEYLNELADKTFKPHNAFSVGEVFNERPEQLPGIMGEDGYFSSMFDFAEELINASEKGWYDIRPVEPEQYKKAVFYSQKRSAGIGFLSNIIENHDEPRGVSRYIPEGEVSETSKKMLAGLYMMLRGLPFIYEGQEIGQENIDFHDISEVDDCSSLGEYRVALDAGLSPEQAIKKVGAISRDNARTPVQWDSSENAGFTTGTPWLRLNPNYARINVAEQEERPDSVLNWYRNLIKIRKSSDYEETLVYGETTPWKEEQKNLLAYFRTGDRKLLILGNYQMAPQEVELPSEVRAVVLNNLDTISLSGRNLRMEGYQYLMLEFA